MTNIHLGPTSALIGNWFGNEPRALICPYQPAIADDSFFPSSGEAAQSSAVSTLVVIIPADQQSARRFVLRQYEGWPASSIFSPASAPNGAVLSCTADVAERPFGRGVSIVSSAPDVATSSSGVPSSSDVSSFDNNFVDFRSVGRPSDEQQQRDSENASVDGATIEVLGNAVVSDSSSPVPSVFFRNFHPSIGGFVGDALWETHLASSPFAVEECSPTTPTVAVVICVIVQDEGVVTLMADVVIDVWI
ncbi:unnamed protein product [Linum trigynum]|uniref:GPI-anchored surface protein n=1 Tax=Linum trigynum TaxID=586398 RepID=A0AAV2DD91_9ROSI